MKIRVATLLLLLSVLLALPACGNKGPLLPPPAPDDADWPDTPPPAAADPDEDEDESATTEDGARGDEVDPDARVDDTDDADDREDAAAEEGVDGEGADPVPGAGPAADGDL